MNVELGGGGSSERPWRSVRKPGDRSGFEPSLIDKPADQSGFSSYKPSLIDKPGEASRSGISERLRGSGPADLTVLIQGETEGAVAEYTANAFEDKILNALWNVGETSADNDGFLKAEDIISALDTNVHVVALRDPSEVALSHAGVPDGSFWSSIIQEAPIGIIDKPLEFIEHCAEIAGMLAGCATGHAALAYACFKKLVHDEIHDLSVAAIEHVMGGDRSHNPGSPSENYLVPSFDPPAHPFNESRLAAETAARARRMWQAEVERLGGTRLRQRPDVPRDRRELSGH
jgi:hypothetical protein